MSFKNVESFSPLFVLQFLSPSLSLSLYLSRSHTHKHALKCIGAYKMEIN